MQLLAIIITASLWIVSIFTFAKWRIAAGILRKAPRNVSADIAFQVYLKLSGLGVLGWIGMLVYGPP